MQICYMASGFINRRDKTLGVDQANSFWKIEKDEMWPIA